MNKTNKLDKVFLLVTSFQTIILGIVFIIQVLRIYYGNNALFTREICAQYILEILPVIILWVLLIIGSFIYFNITNFKYKSVSKISNVTKLSNLERVCPLIDDEEINNKLLNIKKKNLIAGIITIVITVISSVMGLCYLLNIKHFDPTGDLSLQAKNMSLHLMPWVIISFGAFIGYSFYKEFNAGIVCDILREVIKTNGKVIKNKVESKKKNLIMKISQISILCIAIAFIIIGISNGGAEDTLQKAINICTECIGLG